MCDLCTKHGDGKVWYKNAANYSHDLLSDLRRRVFIEHFLDTTFKSGFDTLGRLETIYRKKGRLPGSIKKEMEERALREHYGQVLPMEEIRELVMKSDTIVRMPCACRWTAGRKEVRCCYGISVGAEAWYEGIDMRYFGTLPAEGLETLKREDAVIQMEQMEEQGAIHTIWTMVTPFIGAICNCTLHDCLAMKTLSSIRVETMARAECVAVVDEARCTGCGSCAAHCQFDAVVNRHEGGRVIAQIDTHKCYGCGLCRNACDSGALSLVMR